MKTNFAMMKDLLKEYEPKQFGIVNKDEIYLINEKLCLDEMNELQLRNLRDFTVLFFDSRMDDFDRKEMDKMSAITAVIDQKLWNIGAEV